MFTAPDTYNVERAHAVGFSRRYSAIEYGKGDGPIRDCDTVYIQSSELDTQIPVQKQVKVTNFHSPDAPLL